MVSKYLALLLGTFIFIGCGSGASNKVGSAKVKKVIQTGTGTYVDSPVDGIEYICGEKRGKTGDNGVAGGFIYEKGKPCTFKLKNLEFTKVAANVLKEGIVVKPGIDVARFLQSIDMDGNSTNGITVDAYSIQLLSNAHKIDSLPVGDAILDVVTFLKSNVKTYHGNLKTVKEAEEHLAGFTSSIIVNKSSIVGQNDIFMFDTNITASSAVKMGLVYTWSEGSVIKLKNQKRLTVSDFSPGRHTIDLNITNADGLMVSRSVTVIADEHMVVIQTSKTNYIKDENVTLEANVTGALTQVGYEWKEGSRTLSSITSKLDERFPVGFHTVTVIASANNLEKNASFDFNVSDWINFRRTTFSDRKDRVLLHKELMWIDDGNSSKEACLAVKNDSDYNKSKTFCEDLNFAGSAEWRKPTSSELITFLKDTNEANVLPAYYAPCKILIGVDDINGSDVAVITRYGKKAGFGNIGDVIPVKYNIGLRCVSPIPLPDS